MQYEWSIALGDGEAMAKVIVVVTVALQVVDLIVLVVAVLTVVVRLHTGIEYWWHALVFCSTLPFHLEYNL